MAVETKARVQRMIQRTHDVWSVRVEPALKTTYQAGQWSFLTLPGEAELRKPLSISSAPSDGAYLEFTKKITTSEFSKRFLAMKTADEVTVKYPFGNFVYDGKAKKLLFCSGGIGITPIRSICKDLSDRAVDVDMVLLYGNNTRQDIAFLDELDVFEEKNPKLRIVHILCKADATWAGCTGFITEELVRREVPDFAERQFFVCGPPGMVSALTKIVDTLKVSREQLVLENFSGYA